MGCLRLVGLLAERTSRDHFNQQIPLIVRRRMAKKRPRSGEEAAEKAEQAPQGPPRGAQRLAATSWPPFFPRITGPQLKTDRRAAELLACWTAGLCCTSKRAKEQANKWAQQTRRPQSMASGWNQFRTKRPARLIKLSCSAADS